MTNQTLDVVKGGSANPAGYPLQTRNDSVPVQTGGPAGGQNIHQTKDRIVWSLFNLVHCNPCCLGLVAVLHSVRARDKKMVGDVEGARAEGKKALIFNIIATVICSLAVVIFIIVMIVSASMVHSSRNYPYGR